MHGVQNKSSKDEWKMLINFDHFQMFRISSVCHMDKNMFKCMLEKLFSMAEDFCLHPSLKMIPSPDIMALSSCNIINNIAMH